MNFSKAKYVFLIIFLISIFSVCAQDNTTKKRIEKFKKNKSLTPKLWGDRGFSFNNFKGIGTTRKYYDLGGSLGTANAITDIGGKKERGRSFIMDVQYQKTNLSIAAFRRQYFNPIFSLYTGLNYFRLSGADSLSVGTSRANRNNSFKNDVFEGSVRTELYWPRTHNVFSRKLKSSVEYFVYTGLAAFYNNPKVSGTAYEKENPILYTGYNKVQIAIPFGAGVTWVLPQKYKLGVDIGWRKTFYDHLDGFTRPTNDFFPKHTDDSYFITNFSFSYVMDKNASPYKKKKGKSYRPSSKKRNPLFKRN